MPELPAKLEDEVTRLYLISAFDQYEVIDLSEFFDLVAKYLDSKRLFDENS